MVQSVGINIRVENIYLLTPYTLIKVLMCFDLPNLYQLCYCDRTQRGRTAE